MRTTLGSESCRQLQRGERRIGRVSSLARRLPLHGWRALQRVGPCFARSAISLVSALKARVPIAAKWWLVEHFGAQSVELDQGARIFVFLAADYSNIGDLAITVAQTRFIKRNFPDRALIIVPVSCTLRVLRSIMKQIAPNDVVTIIGGGNMGSMYPNLERLRQLIIRRFPANRIVCFPQSLDWTEDDIGSANLRDLARSYARHRDLTVFSRESISFVKMKEIFAEFSHIHVECAPDIAFTLRCSDFELPPISFPDGILLCLRNDKESALSESQRAVIGGVASGFGENVRWTDTHLHTDDRIVAESLRQRLVAEKLEEFRAARLVVTDRLHGMILAVIAGVPCLAVRSANHKITQTWKDWLRHCDSVDMLTDFDAVVLEASMRRLLESSVHYADGIDVKLYQPIFTAISSQKN